MADLALLAGSRQHRSVCFATGFSVLSVQIPLKRAMRFLINILRSVLMMGEKVFHILTPHMIEYILSAAEISGGKLYMSFLKEGKLHLRWKVISDFLKQAKAV